MYMVDEISAVGAAWDNFSDFAIIAKRQIDIAHILPERCAAHCQAYSLNEALICQKWKFSLPYIEGQRI